MLPLLLGLGLTCLAGGTMAHDCKCRYLDGEAKQGEFRCLKTGDGFRLARCEMVLNNSSWKFLQATCTPEQVSRRTPMSLPRQVAA